VGDLRRFSLIFIHLKSCPDMSGQQSKARGEGDIVSHRIWVFIGVGCGVKIKGLFPLFLGGLG
jgi:hypothetical protein